MNRSPVSGSPMATKMKPPEPACDGEGIDALLDREHVNADLFERVDELEGDLNGSADLRDDTNIAFRMMQGNIRRGVRTLIGIEGS